MKQLSFIGICVLLLYSCGNQRSLFPQNKIEYGTSMLSVKFDASIPDTILNSPVELSLLNSVTEDFTIVSLTTDNENPRIRIKDIPVWFITHGNCSFTAENSRASANFYLAPNKKTDIYISMSNTGELVLSVDMPVNFTSEELLEISEVLWSGYQSNSPNRTDFTEGAYGDILFVKEWINRAKNNIHTRQDITREVKDIASLWVGLPVMNIYLENHSYQIAPISSLFFLEDLYLNDFRHLYYSYDYFLFIKQLLYHYSADLPPIGETRPDEWIDKIDEVVGGWVSHRRGLFYDMLVMINYSNQLSLQALPFSPIQIENMKAYFKNESYVKVLLEENEKIIERNESNLRYNITSVSHSTPCVLPEELMSTIIEQYHGNVVFVDFWATWCVPCISGIESMKPMKEDLADKNVVFLYITNESSPLPTFEKAITNISGEHYRLTMDEMSYLLDYYFDSSSIPNYLIFDKAGNLVKIINSEDFNVESIQQTLKFLLES